MATDNEMVRWHHWLNRHEFEETWKIVNDREPGYAQAMWSQRVGHDLVIEQQ